MPQPRPETVTACVRERLGPRSKWAPTPPGYPDGLALCVIDSIWSMGVNYGGVKNVVSRYRSHRRGEDADPERDGLDELLAVFERLGVDGFTDAISNRQRTSSRSGIPKSEAVLNAVRILGKHGIATASDLRTAPAYGDVERAWRKGRGQGSGISWHYLRILVGSQDIKPDRMIKRFLRGCLGYLPDADEATSVLEGVALDLNCDLRTLDHAVWRCQRRRISANSAG